MLEVFTTALELSENAAIIDERTINKKLVIVSLDILQSNQKTSPYAIKMIVKFLNIVYTGIERYCKLFKQIK